MACVSNFTFAYDGTAIDDRAVNLVFERREHCEEIIHCGPNAGASCDGRGRTETEYAVARDKTQKALRVHPIDGREELVKLHAADCSVTHC